MGGDKHVHDLFVDPGALGMLTGDYTRSRANSHGGAKDKS